MPLKQKDYELMPHEKIEALKKEIDRLRAQEAGTHKKPTSSDIKETMEKLTETLADFMSAFEEAATEMKIEEREEELIVAEIKPLKDRLDKIIEQNEKIARGIVAVANMLNEDIPEMKRILSRHATPAPAHAMPTPTHVAPPRMAPRMPAPHQSARPPMPPPPMPGNPAPKKGLFK